MQYIEQKVGFVGIFAVVVAMARSAYEMTGSSYALAAAIVAATGLVYIAVEAVVYAVMLLRENRNSVKKE